MDSAIRRIPAARIVRPDGRDPVVDDLDVDVVTGGTRQSVDEPDVDEPSVHPEQGIVAPTAGDRL